MTAPLKWAPLQHLSLQRAGRDVPAPLTNEQRLKAYRPYMPAQFGGRLLNLSPGELYALRESIDNSTPTTDVHYLEWTR